MNTNLMRGIPAALVVSAVVTVLGTGCAMSDPRVDPAESEDTVGSVEEKLDNRICANAPNTTACGRSIGFGGDRDTLYTCKDRVLLGEEKCPGTCQHRPWGLSDFCI